MTHLVEVRKSEPGQLPFTNNTIRKLHSQKRYPSIIFKVGPFLYFDMDEWKQEAKKSKARTIKEANRVTRSHEG